MNATDIPSAIRLSSQEDWGTPRSDFERILQVSPHGSFVARENNSRVGMITSITFGRRLAWIGNIIVDKNQRGKHIGQTLVKYAIHYLNALRVRHIGLYCFENNVGFYEKLGFIKDTTFTRLRRESHKPARITYPDSQKQLTLQQLISLDSKAFGVNRSRLLRALITSGHGSYSGFSTGKRGTFLVTKKYKTTYDFGPCVALNTSDEELRQLVAGSVNSAWRKPIEASCLDLNREMLHLLKQHDFHTINHGHRMFFKRKARLGSDRLSCLLGFLDKG
jgi:N-acetylglutamate synthase-like GNAT family acetyltransferase